MDRVEAFLRQELGAHPEDLLEHAMRELGLGRDQIARSLQGLLQIGEIEEQGRQLRWKPAFRARVEPGLEEDRIWLQAVAPRLGDVPENVRSILGYGTTEMLNNVFDHSGATEVVVVVRRLAEEVEIYIEDDGVGIFTKLQREKGLEDPSHVALELAKGKLTTDPDRHTGQGIFFTARMCDKFLIWSDTTVCGQVDRGEWHVRDAEPRPGTTVRMAVKLSSRLTPKQVFDEFFPKGAEDTFAKTRIDVSQLQQNGASLVSRSQGKRLLARCEEFREVVLDFRGIDSIGPAFADEVFRVFPAQHPEVVVRHENAGEEVLRMIERARKNAVPGTPG